MATSAIGSVFSVRLECTLQSGMCLCWRPLTNMIKLMVGAASFQVCSDPGLIPFARGRQQLRNETMHLK